METRNIFIDTSIFIKQNYNYRSSVFENLVRLAKQQKAFLFLTDITVREIKAHIESDVSDAANASSKFKNKAKILKNLDKSPFIEIFQDIDETGAIDQLQQQLTDFIEQSNSEVLPIGEVTLTSIFDKYFEKQPPFGEGKKKAEFPDAFALKALEDWCAANNEKMYVASTDPDLKSYCESNEFLFSLDGIAEFIHLVTFHDEVLAPAVEALFESNKNLIEEAIAKSFVEQGFWIDDQEGDVNEVYVDSIEITNMLLLQVNESKAILQLEVNTEFSADLTYDDLETASYDSEDKVLIPWQSIDKTVSQDISYTVIACIRHDINDANHFELESIELLTSGIAVSSDDEWPYK